MSNAQRCLLVSPKTLHPIEKSNEMFVIKLSKFKMNKKRDIQEISLCQIM